jgi:IPT/TIG domain
MGESKDSTSRSNRPHISYIDPTTVKQNDEVSLTVIGENFISTSLVFVDAHVPVTKVVSDTRLEAKLTREETGSLGSKSVLVHDAETGDISNSVTLTVERASDS